jgi:alpha-soluble NSF attachment protein
MAGGDSVAARTKLDEFKNVDYSLPSSRECDLLEKLLVATDSYNAEDFSQACADYDRISPLDPWKTSMLLKAKRHITAAAGDEGDVDLT